MYRYNHFFGLQVIRGDLLREYCKWFTDHLRYQQDWIESLGTRSPEIEQATLPISDLTRPGAARPISNWGVDQPACRALSYETSSEVTDHRFG